MGIDFSNKKIFKLKQEETINGQKTIGNLLIPDELVIGSYVSMRDRVIFTNKRIVSVNVQGITGSKVDYTSIPYKKIQYYSIETAGSMDLDSELEVYLSGGNNIKFEFFGNNNIIEIGKIISQFIL